MQAASPGYRPATRWCGPSPGRSAAVAPVRAAARPRGRREVLLQLLDESLARGHWKLAVRRFLMLLACDCDVPAEQRSRCEFHLARCREGELRKMEADVQAWRRCVAAE
jgi:hypothetical protein